MRIGACRSAASRATLLEEPVIGNASTKKSDDGSEHREVTPEAAPPAEFWTEESPTTAAAETPTTRHAMEPATDVGLPEVSTETIENLHPADVPSEEAILIDAIDAVFEPPAAPQLTHERAFGRFLFHRRLSMFDEGEVWLAYERREGESARPCVVKTLSIEVAPPESLRRERFATEARVGRLVRHPHIVEIFDSGEHEGTQYLARESVEGITLAAMVAAAPDVFDRLSLLAALGFRIADALSYAHNLTDRGGAPLHLIHGELCPSTILISRDGTPKLTEFGLSRVGDRPLNPHKEGRRGRVGYMSPEQMRGKDLDARTDMFALGIILVELLGGGPLGDGNLSLDDLADEVMDRCTARDDVTSSLTALLLRMTALSPIARPDDASEVATLLKTLAMPRGKPILLLESELSKRLELVTEHDLLDATTADGGNARSVVLADRTIVQPPTVHETTVSAETLAGPATMPRDTGAAPSPEETSDRPAGTSQPPLRIIKGQAEDVPVMPMSFGAITEPPKSR